MKSVKPGPKPNPLARRRGKRVLISPTHIKIADGLKVDPQSRADVIELALEYYERFLDDLETLVG